MEEKEESRSTVAPKSDEAFAPIPFHHPSDKYRKVAPIAAVVVAVGGFFLSMVGDGEPNYDIMTAGAFGCCSLFNVAFISQAIYQRNLIQHHAIHGGEKTGSQPVYIAALLLAFLGMAILLGNLFSNY
ncbi:MAG: hypothetical protein VXW36_01435 [Candidatus Thermoplasmatota archaeon]|nr:hypothetical protein [Candidatus Thermoplasmatota archaeon]